MAKYRNFEDLPVWNDAIDLGVALFELTEHPVFRYKGDVVNQVRRAVLSISNNIAEGFERGTTRDLITFLYYSRGSAGETRSICRFALRLKALEPCHAELRRHVEEAAAISRQLRAWLDSLQNTDIKGQRYLNEQSRREYERRNTVTDFQKHMDSFKERMEQGLRDGTWGRGRGEGEKE